MSPAKRMVVIAWLGLLGLLVAVPPWDSSSHPGHITHAPLTNPATTGPRRQSTHPVLAWHVLLIEAASITALCTFAWRRADRIAAWYPWRFRRPTSNTCPHCGYDLRGSPEGGACPECGQATASTRSA